MRFTLTIFFTVLAAGCGTFVTATPLNQSPRPLSVRPPHAIPILSSGPPGRAYVDVALLEVEQGDSSNDRAEMLRHLRARAGQLGCDALVIGGIRQTGSDAEVFHFGSTTLHATCIVYTPTPPPG